MLNTQATVPTRRLNAHEPRGGVEGVLMMYSTPLLETAEGLYCKRPIQCLASSEILTPHPLTAWRVCTPPPLVRGEDTLAGWRGGGGVNSSEDDRHCSVLYLHM
jgi:hypothetical protein